MIAVRLKLISPAFVFTSSLLFLALMIVFSPVSLDYSGTFPGWLYFFTSVVFFYIGYFIISPKISLSKTAVIYVKKADLKRFFNLLLIFSFVGVLLHVVDSFFLRNLNISNDFMENREALNDSGSSMLSLVSSFFYPSVLALPFVFLIRHKYIKKSNFMLGLVLILFCSEILLTLLVGSRIFLLITFFLIFIYAYTLGYITLTKQIAIRAVVISIILITVSGYMFYIRAELFGLDGLVSTQISGYAFFAPLNNAAYEFIDSFRDSPIIFYFLIGITTLMQYFVHSLYELLYVVENFDTSNILLGNATFNVYFKLIYYFGLIEDYSTTGVVLREGVYRTFWGNLYYDFGVFGVFFSFIFGMVMAKLYLIRSFGLILFYPLFSYLLMVVLFSPYFNLISNGKGLYFITSCILVVVVYKIPKVKF